MTMILPIRITQCILVLIVLGLTSYCVNITVGFSQAAFLVFTSVWTFILLIYLLITPLYFPNLHNRWAVVVAEAITVIFWFSGFIAIAIQSNRLVCIYTGCHLIGATKAAAVFSAFSWIAWSLSFALVVYAVFKSRDGEAGDPESGNNSLPVISYILNGREGRGFQTEGHPNVDNGNGQDIETSGGGQGLQQSLELKLPEPVLMDDVYQQYQHQSRSQSLTPPPQRTYGHPPDSNEPGYAAIPEAKDFGGNSVH